MRYLRIRNFEKYQHYKDRRPPWIKLYRDLWNDPEFFVLTETERYFLISFFIVASQNDNRIPDDQAWFKREMATSKRVPVERLMEKHWLEEIPEPASKSASTAASKPASTPLAEPLAEPLANGYQNASSALAFARSREKEKYKEEKKIQEEEPSVLSDSSNTANAAVSSVANERTYVFEPSEEFQKYWGPVEGYIRKQVVEESFNAFYAGCLVLDMNHRNVILAVPEALIERNQGPETTAKVLAHTIDKSGTGFLRGRALRVVPLNGFKAAE